MPPPKARRASAAALSVPKDRRLHAEAGSLRRMLRWMKSLFRRPIGIVGPGGGRRLGFVERRTRPADALSVEGLRKELRQRLLALSAERADRHFRHLVQVHDELGHAGWAGVASLPAPVLARALIQADVLRRDAPSPAMKQFVDKLRTVQPPRPEPTPAAKAGDASANSEHESRWPPGGISLEVSEATHEDFEASRRSWFAELPPEPPPAQEGLK